METYFQNGKPWFSLQLIWNLSYGNVFQKRKCSIALIDAVKLQIFSKGYKWYGIIVVDLICNQRVISITSN